MNKRLLTVLSICLVIGAGIALYVWASGCCPTGPLCNGGAAKLPSGCDYAFTVQLDVDCVESASVVLHLRKNSQDYDYFPMQLVEDPQDMCADYYVVVYDLDPEASYSYYFDSRGGEFCSDREPDVGAKLLMPDCD